MNGIKKRQLEQKYAKTAKIELGQCNISRHASELPFQNEIDNLHF